MKLSYVIDVLVFSKKINEKKHRYQRCWKIVKEVKDEIELCNRCTGVLKKNK